MLSEVKLILHNLRMAGCGISRNVVISVGNGVMQTKCPEKLAKNGGPITLSVKWARGILKSMDWSKKRGTTAEREMNPALYEELSFSWKRDIAGNIFNHKIPEAPIFNMDQTPLGQTSASKVSFAPRGSKKVPIANIDDKRMITGTFCVSLKGDILPLQLIYAGKTDLCHPKNVKFPKGFQVTHTENHWSNGTVHMEYLKKNIFPYIENIRKSLSVGKDQKALLIFDIFKGQTTGAVPQLLKENHCLSVKVPANHRDLFQPLGLTVNKPAKAFVSNKYQQWYADKVSKQLSQEVAPHDVKVDVKLSIVKPLHVEWVVEYYQRMQLVSSKAIITSGFKKAKIREAFDQAESLATYADNAFLEIEIDHSQHMKVTKTF